jgi:hypothetical protein
MDFTWTTALSKLPEEIQVALREDGYTSPDVFSQCFWEEGAANGFARLDKYGKGLVLVRKVVQISEEILEFHPVMGDLRGLLLAANEVVQAMVKAKRDLANKLEEAQGILLFVCAIGNSVVLNRSLALSSSPP